LKEKKETNASNSRCKGRKSQSVGKKNFTNDAHMIKEKRKSLCDSAERGSSELNRDSDDAKSHVFYRRAPNNTVKKGKKTHVALPFSNRGTKGPPHKGKNAIQ